MTPSAAEAQYVNFYYANFGKNKVQYRDFKWKIYHSPHFDVYYYTEQKELLQKVVSYAESAYDQLSQEFDYQIQKPTPLIFYETHSAFEQNNEIPNFIPEGIGAFASPVRNRMFMPIDLPDADLWALILHELTHIFQYHVLFGGSLGRGVAAGAPQWLMEGMASYMEGEESARDKMFVRDAVVNDNIPAITQSGVGGFFSYRFGYSVFEFMEDRWGKEGVRDFLIEFRNTLGGRVGKAIERAFQMYPEDFDLEFRRWLRQRYLAELLKTGEPSDFGRPFRLKKPGAQNISPVASPSGDLVAAFGTAKGDIDVVLYDTQSRTQIKNLTKGYSGKYQYYVVQEFTMGRNQGRDLTFSPDGDFVAFFARKNKGRNLVLVSVLKGGIKRSIPMDIEQQFAPTWSPDGRKIAFSGWQKGNFDIFELDLDTQEIVNLTNDDIFDAAPVYSPDGQYMLITSTVGGYSKIFRIDLDNPEVRIPLREGIRSQTNETDPTFSPDGRRIYFTSDASGANNIFSFDLDSGLIQQHTNTITGAFQPTVLSSPDGVDRIVFSAYWKGRFDLYYLDVEDPITEPSIITEEQIADAKSLRDEELPRFEPSIEVTLDDANIGKYRGWKFYLDNVIGGTIGISDDQTFVAQIGFVFNDFMGDREILALFESISSFQNFDVLFIDQSNRIQWGLHLFDRRDYYVAFDGIDVQRVDTALKQTGFTADLRYPLGVNYRLEFGGGYIDRSYNRQAAVIDPDTGEYVPFLIPISDNYPIIQGSFVGDSGVYASYGAISGRRFRFFANWAPDLDKQDNADNPFLEPDGSTLTSTIGMDFRQYIKVTRRSQIAFRLAGAMSDGNDPTPIYIGGLDTLRGFDFRTLVGDRAWFSNVEYRFPLIDVLAFPGGIVFQGIRGGIFFDIGGAWYDNLVLADGEDFQCFADEGTQLEDCVSSYGFGFTVRFLGLNLNWDFARQWDLSQNLEDGFSTAFWIGRRF